MFGKHGVRGKERALNATFSYPKQVHLKLLLCFIKNFLITLRYIFFGEYKCTNYSACLGLIYRVIRSGRSELTGSGSNTVTKNRIRIQRLQKNRIRIHRFKKAGSGSDFCLKTESSSMFRPDFSGKNWIRIRTFRRKHEPVPFKIPGSDHAANSGSGSTTLIRGVGCLI